MKLSDRLHLLLLQAVKAAGSFDPKQNLHYVEEQMTLDEAKLAQDFLQWVTDNKRAFGHGTIRDVWRDWQLTLADWSRIAREAGATEAAQAAQAAQLRTRIAKCPRPSKS